MRQILFASLACAELTASTGPDMTQAVDGLSLTSRVSNFLRGKNAKDGPQDKSLLGRFESADQENGQEETASSSKKSSGVAENLSAFGQNKDGLTRYVYHSSGPLGQLPGNMPRMADWMPAAAPMFPPFFPGSFNEFGWLKPIEPAFFGAFPIYKPASFPMLAQVTSFGGEDIVAEAAIEEVAIPEAEVPTVEDKDVAVAEAIAVEEFAQPIEIVAEPLASNLPIEIAEDLAEPELIELAPPAESRVVVRKSASPSSSSHTLLLETLLQEKAAAEAALAKMQAQIAYYDLMAKQQAMRPAALAPPAQPPALPPMTMSYMKTDAVISDLLKDMFKPLGVPTQVGSPIINF